MLCGRFKHTIDNKNRLFIPAKHREQLGECFVIMQNTDGCLDVVTLRSRQELEEKLNSFPRSQTAEIRRFLFSQSCECVPDSQGRVVIPTPLMEFAEIEKNVVIIGVGDHVEIWSERRWDEHMQSSSIEKISADMIALGI